MTPRRERVSRHHSARSKIQDRSIVDPTPPAWQDCGGGASEPSCRARARGACCPRGRVRKLEREHGKRGLGVSGSDFLVVERRVALVEREQLGIGHWLGC
jgi:hypothetical protein